MDSFQWGMTSGDFNIVKCSSITAHQEEKEEGVVVRFVCLTYIWIINIESGKYFNLTFIFLPHLNIFSWSV